MSTDRLVFRRPDGDLVCGWAGPWPPPGRMTMVTGAVTGQTALYDPDNPRLDPNALALLLARGASTEGFRLLSASEAPAPAEPGAHRFRGALYVPGEPS